MINITEGKPVAWYCKGTDKFGEFYSYVVGGEKPVSEVYSEIIPLYTHPASEPKPAPLPDEVAEMVNELRCNHGKFGDTVADMIELLARQVPPVRLYDYINSANINTLDMPHTVVEKLQAAIDAARGVK